MADEADEADGHKKIGNFIVLGKIGNGGMGTVYKAQDPALDRIVALKLLPTHLAEDADYVRRFKLEATAAAKLSHSNLVQVHAAGQDRDIHYIAMEFVNGESLKERLQRHTRLSPVEAFAIAVYVVEALRHAWKKAKIIHRDIKPDNILLSKDGEVKVADLGLAKSMEKIPVTMATVVTTTTGKVMGSPFYISPEQAQGRKQIDFRTDMYSLGCTLYHMLAGQPPFTDEATGALFYKHIHEIPPSLDKLYPECPPRIVQLVQRMMSKDPSQRHPTYDALLSEMKSIYHELKRAPAQKAAEMERKEHRTLWWIYGGAAVAFLLIAGVFVWNGMKSGGDKPRATVQTAKHTSALPPALVAATPGIQPTGVSVVPDSPAQGNIINLLALVNVEKDSLAGKWKLMADHIGLGFSNTNNPNAPCYGYLRLPYIPPDEYDITIRFRGTTAAPQPLIFIPTGFDGLLWQPNYGGKWSFFGSHFDGRSLVGRDSGEAPIEQTQCIPAGEMHTTTVEVRKGLSLRGLIDGKEVVRWHGDPQRFTIKGDRNAADVKDQKELVVGRLNRELEIYSIEVREITGKGHFTRGSSSELPPNRVLASLGTTPPTIVDDAFIKEVAALPALQQVQRVAAKLKELNPGFDGQVTPTIANEKAVGLEFSTANIFDIAPVRALRDLNYLKCEGPGKNAAGDRIKIISGKVFDLSPLRGLKLQSLAIARNHISDLSPLTGMSLTNLDCARTDVADLLPLAGMPLKSLNCYECKVTDCTSLKGAPVVYLDLHACPLGNLSSLKDLPLQYLDVSCCRSISDLTPLAGMPLTHLDCWSTLVSDLTPLKGMHLNQLHIFYTKVKDISPLRGSTSGQLWMDRTLVEDLSPLRDMLVTDLQCDFKAERDTAILHSIKTLKKINTLPVAEFWEKVDAGKIPGADKTADASVLPTASATAVTISDREADWSKAINLMPLIDPEKDAVVGSWHKQSNELVSEGAQKARLELPYQPADEYDLRIEFTSQGGSQRNEINQILVTHGHPFLWKMGVGYNPTVCCFHVMDKAAPLQLTAGENLSAGTLTPEGKSSFPVAVEASLTAEHRYTSVVQVRHDGFTAFLDGKLILQCKTDHRNVSMENYWALRNPLCLGIASQISPAIFHRIAVREVTGKGTFTRFESVPVVASVSQTSSDNTDAAFTRQLASLPASQQMALVLARLKELNPKFDAAKSSFKIEGGAVMEFAFSTVGVTNIMPVRALAALKKLTMVPWNAKERGDLTSLEPLVGLSLTWLWCHNNPIKDLKPLRDLPLTNLSIGRTRVTELDPLTELQLTVLSCPDTEVSDLAPLEGQPLTVLWIQNTKVSSLAPLVNMPLQELRCDFDLKRDAKYLRNIRTLTKINNTAASAFWTFHHLPMPTFGPVTKVAKTAAATATISAREQIRRFTEKMKELNPAWDGIVEPVVESKKVVELDFCTIGVTNINPIRALPDLRAVRCNGRKGKDNAPSVCGDLDDLSPLQGLKLTILECELNPIKDLSPLKDMHLVNLKCGNTKVNDLAPLTGMALTQLDCEHDAIKDLKPLKDLPLTKLHCGYTRIEDLAPLTGMVLTKLDIACTMATDLTPLKGMPLDELSCWSTRISDLSPLKGAPLRALTCLNTKVSDLSPLKGMPLTELRIQHTKVADLSILQTLPLKRLDCDFVPDRDKKLLRSILTLESINHLPVDEFWKRVANGESPKSK